MTENIVANQREFIMKGKIARAFRAIASHPTVLFSLGDLFLSITTGNPIGAMLQGAVAIITAAIVAKSSWSGKPADALRSRYAFFVTGTVATVTAIIGFMTAFPLGLPSIDKLLADNAARNAFLGNAAFAFWGAGDYLTALLSKKNMVAYGGGEISSACSNPQAFNMGPFIATVAGFIKSLYDSLLPARAAEHEKNKDLIWHITPSRLYVVSYIFNGCTGLTVAIASGDMDAIIPAAEFLIATAFWTASTLCFNPEQNKDLRDRLKKYFANRCSQLAKI